MMIFKYTHYLHLLSCVHMSFKMETRGLKGKRKVYDKIYYMQKQGEKGSQKNV